MTNLTPPPECRKTLFCSLGYQLIIPMALAGLLLTSCMVGPDYKKPEVLTPEEYKYAPDVDLKPLVYDGEWWQIFNEETLNDLIDRMDRGNFDLMAAAARVRQARATARIRRSPLFPFFSADPSYQDRESSETTEGSVGGRYTTWQFPFNVAYEIDLFGRIRRGYEAAEADAQSVAEDFEAILLILRSEVAIDYFALRSLDDEIRMVERAVDVRKEQLKILDSRFEFGIVSQLPVAQAKAELNATRALLFSLQRERAKLENAIAVLLGLAPSELSIPYDPLAEDPPYIPVAIPSRLLTERPDIRRAERNLAAANARIGVAEAEFYPQINIGADAGFASANFSDLFDSRSFTWGILPNISIPIFQGGRLSANLEQARARYAEVYADYRQTIVGAFGEVEDALVSVQLLKKQDEANKLAVQASQEAYDLSQRQFEGGLVNYLNVLDTERTLLENARLESQIRGLRFTSTVNLIKAIGGSWNPAPD